MWHLLPVEVRGVIVALIVLVPVAMWTAALCWAADCTRKHGGRV